jgi:hypothetical protein
MTTTVYTGRTTFGVERTMIEIDSHPLLQGVISPQTDLFWVLDRRTMRATAAGQRSIGTRTIDEVVELLTAEILASEIA